MGISAAYRSAISTHLPEAMNVLDHFHVVKLFNEKLPDLRRTAYREATEEMHKEASRGRVGFC
jgi:transposase